MTSSDLYANSPRTMVIVANGMPTRDMAREVDGSDIVMRFNDCRSLNHRWSGSKTDIICIRTYGKHGKRYADGVKTIHQDAIDSAKEFWFMGDAHNWSSGIIERYGIHSRKHVFYSGEDMGRVSKVLARLGNSGKWGGTLGTITVARVVAEPAFQDNDVQACCFRLDGAGDGGHPLKQEKRLLEIYCCTGRIRVLDQRPFFQSRPRLRHGIDYAKNQEGVTVSDTESEPVRLDGAAAKAIPAIDGTRTVAEIFSLAANDQGPPSADAKVQILTALWCLEDRNMLEWRHPDSVRI